MKFMACSLLALVSRARCNAKRCAAEPGPVYSRSKWVPVLQCVTCVPQCARDAKSDPCHIELRLLAGAVAAQRAVFTDCIGALENPVLPRRQAREDFRLHRLRPDEAQIGFHAGKAVRR